MEQANWTLDEALEGEELTDYPHAVKTTARHRRREQSLRRRQPTLPLTSEVAVA